MKKHLILVTYLLLTFFFLMPVESKPASLTAEIDLTSKKIENLPLKGTITILHKKTDLIDLSSFNLDGKALNVDQLQEVNPSSLDELTLSIFRFELPGKSAGLHVLPEIKARVGEVILTSIPSAYEVEKAGESWIKNEAENKAPNEGEFLKLEVFLEGPEVLYVGQTAKVVYQFSYSGSIQLIKEELPILNGEDFLLIGEPIIKNLEENSVSIKQYIQVIEAKKEGVFNLGPSVIKGVFLDSGHQISSHAKALTLRVLPLPLKGQPVSFTGAVGQYTFKVVPQSRLDVFEEESVFLTITISGQESLYAIRLPDFCCLPEVSGRFQCNSSSLAGEVQGQEKRFILDLKPLSASIKEIPPLQFSYFDPILKKYLTVKSDPFPLKVKKKSQENLKQEPLKNDEIESLLTWEAQTDLPAIEPIYPLTENDVTPLFATNWKMMIIFPWMIVFLIFEKRMKKEREING